MLFSFSGCSKNKNVINIKSEKTNYNNIYNFAHSGFWVNNNSIYYRKSGFYNNFYYRIDNKGKELITTDNKFNLLVAKDSKGEIGAQIQAFGNNMYFWYLGENKEQSDLYQYNTESKDFKKVLSVSQNVYEWTIVDNILIYSAFIDGYDENLNSLWCCSLNSEETPIEIADKTSAFGIRKNKIVYTKRDTSGQATLYEYDYENKKSAMLCSFDGLYKNYNPYNFTEKSVVFATDKLHVVDIKTGLQKSFDLPGYADYFNCYEEYAFVYLRNNIYRVNLLTGKIELICEKLEECFLLNPISDECIVAISYGGSSVRTKVEVYAIYADGKIEKMFNI